MAAASHADRAVQELLDKQALYEVVTRYYEHHERTGLHPAQFIHGSRDRSDPSYDRPPVASRG